MNESNHQQALEYAYQIVADAANGSSDEYTGLEVKQARDYIALHALAVEMAWYVYGDLSGERTRTAFMRRADIQALLQTETK